MGAVTDRPSGTVVQDAAADPAAQARPAINHLAGALVALVFGAGLTAAAHESALALLVAVAVTQGVLVLAWVLGSGMPGRIGGLVIGGLAAAGADVMVSRWPHGQLGALLAVLAFVMPVLFVHQLTRGVVRARVLESLSEIALLVVSVVAIAALMQLRHESDGVLMTEAVTLAAGGALLVGHLVDMAWAGPRFDADVPRGLLAVVAATAAGAAAGYLRLSDSVEFSSGRALFVGAVVGAVVSLFAVGTGFAERTLAGPSGRSPAMRWLRPIAAVLIPLALVSPIGYLLCLAVRG